MASCLLKSECVNLEQKLYKMTWWATAINQISVPSGMNMSGGSVAVITTSDGVECYRYNANACAWKKESTASELASKIDALENDVVIENVSIPIADVGVGATLWINESVAKTGYNAIGVGGWYMNGGTANTFLMPYCLQVYNNTSNVAVRNIAGSGGSTASGVTLVLSVIYKKA